MYLQALCSNFSHPLHTTLQGHITQSSKDIIFFSRFVRGWNHESWDCLNYHTSSYYGLHTNVEYITIFKINIVNLLIIHVFIDFNGNHHNFFGWILRRLWTRNGLLKWQYYVSHIEKWKMWIQINVKVVSNEKKY